jgi:tetratricopeptide (TPR) repeat protein
MLLVLHSFSTGEYYMLSHSNQKTQEIYNTGNEFYDNEDYEKALTYYFNAHELDSTNPLYIHDIGLMYSFIGNPEKAIEYYEMGLELVQEKDHIIKFWRRLGEVLIDCKDTRKGIEYYEKALAARIELYGEQHKLVIESHNDLGFAWRRLSQYRKSIEHFEKAIDYFEKALRVRKLKLGEYHDFTTRTARLLSAAQNELKENNRNSSFLNRLFKKS